MPMTKSILLGLIIGVVLMAGLFVIMPLEEASAKPKVSKERDNVIVNSITLQNTQRMVIVDNAGIGATSDVEVTWRFNPNWCQIQTFDGTTFTPLNTDTAYGLNPAHGDAFDVEAVVLVGISSTDDCVINPDLGHFVTVSTVGSEKK